MTEREQIFYKRITSQPKRFPDLVKESGIDYQECEEIVKNLKKQNKIIVEEIDSGYGSPVSLIYIKSQKRLLSPEDKDRLLDCLLDNCTIEIHSNILTKDLCELSGLSRDELNALLAQFNRNGLLKYDGMSHSTVDFVLYQEASDFKREGGYRVQEVIIQANLEKLLLEIKDLEKTHSWEKLATMTTIVSSIITSIAAFRTP
jgi:hypothetical protein